MSFAKHSKLIILGSGPAGYTAGIYAARTNFSPLLITGKIKGGQLINASNIENWPADHNGINGFDLMNRFFDHANKFNVKIIEDHIYKAILNKNPIQLEGEYNIYTCDALIIATGASAKYLGIISEKKFIGRGVSVCATCDGFFYKNKVVCIVGGGNTAIEDALYLSNIVKKIFIIHRRDKLSADPILINRLLDKNKLDLVEIKWNYVVEEIFGNDSGVNRIKIKNIKNNSYTEIDVEGIFIAIGHKPNSDIFYGQLEMNNGYILTNFLKDNMITRTNVHNVFAAGDVQDCIYRQAITSAGTGCMAALDACRYLSSL